MSNITGGKTATSVPLIKFDNYGMQKFEAQQNHSRITQQPRVSFY